MAERVEFDALIKWGREERHLEYKQPLDWKDPAVKAKLTRTALALANVRGGGSIVLGLERRSDDSYSAVGMLDALAEAFVQDHTSAHFAEFADPYLETTTVKHTRPLGFFQSV